MQIFKVVIKTGTLFAGLKDARQLLYFEMRNAMRQDLLDILKRITPEEQELLDGGREIQKERYTNRKDFVVDSRLLLEKGRLIEIRPHTRFAYFPKHRHNYVEMVYMCAGKTTHIINGTKELTLEEGDLLFLNQNVYHEILPSGENDIAVNFIILPEFFDRPPSHDGYDQPDLHGLASDEPVQICRSDRPR